MKKIAIDIREAVAQNPAGKGIYNLNIVKELIKEKSVQWVLLSDKPTDIFKDVEVISEKGFKWHLKAAQYVDENNFDHYLSPTSYLTPIFLKETPFSIVVHDLICFIFPKGHSLKPRIIERLTLPRLLKRATNIFTVSNHTKKDLLALFPHTEENKITVTKCGVDISKFKPTPKKKKQILTVSTLLPRKNILGLLKAFNGVKEKVEHKLVIVGGKGSSLGKIKKYIEKNNLQGRVELTGYVEDLAKTYAESELFVYPSFYEGFGIPVIEALASGTKVACSDRSSLPEAAGSSAFYFNPDSPEDMAEVIVKALESKDKPKYENELSWQKVAEQLFCMLSK